jgi:hypothetical protein
MDALRRFGKMTRESDRRRRSTKRLLAATAILVVATACVPLPIPHTALVTPSVRGTLRDGDGTPVRGAVLGVTDDHRDRACRRLAARDTTDERGRFELPAMHRRRRIFWLTLMENFGMMGYWVCAVPPDSTLPERGVARSSATGRMSGDSLRCVDWSLAGEWRMSCESLERRIVEGGEWKEEGRAGHYQLLATDSDDWGAESIVAIQWITDSATGPRIVATTLAPAGERLQDATPSLLARDGRWYAKLTGFGSTGWHGGQRHPVLELGPPRRVRLLPESAGQRVMRK